MLCTIGTTYKTSCVERGRWLELLFDSVVNIQFNDAHICSPCAALKTLSKRVSCDVSALYFISYSTLRFVSIGDKLELCSFANGDRTFLLCFVLKKNGEVGQESYRLRGSVNDVTIT